MNDHAMRTRSSAPPAQRARAAVVPGPNGAALAGLHAAANRRTGAVAQRALGAQLNAPRANRTGLPDELKAGIESLSGLSMDDVRVHRNSARPAQLQAHAYAQGNEIHLAPGQDQHLPHEAWHVVQQKQGRVRPTLQMADGVAVNDDQALEREADTMGATAAGNAVAREPVTGAAPAVPAADAPAQLFTDREISSIIETQSLSSDAARLQLILQIEPEATLEGLEESRLARARYAAGEALPRETMRLIALYSSEDELAAAVHARQEKLGKLGTPPVSEEPVSENETVKDPKGDRSWANSGMNAGLNEMRRAQPEFDTGHHKASKTKLARATEKMSSEQQKRLRLRLDLPDSVGSRGFKSLGSNVTGGPRSSMRIDERGNRFDGNRYVSGALTPRSSRMQRVDQLTDRINDQQLKNGTGVPTEDFDALLETLDQAERLHYAKTGGEIFDSDTAMWLEIPMSTPDTLRPSFWIKKAQPDPEVDPTVPEASVRDLKLPRYRAQAPQTRGRPHPELLSGHHAWLGDGIKIRAANIYSPGTATVESANAWALSGYATSEVEGGLVRRSRVDPAHLKARFGTLAQEINNPKLGEAFGEILDAAAAAIDNFTFEAQAAELLERFDDLRTAIAEMAGDGVEASEARRKLTAIVTLVMHFIEGPDAVAEDPDLARTTLADVGTDG